VHYKNQLSGPVANKMVAALDDDDLILFSDLDEIVGLPSLQAMSESMPRLPVDGGTRIRLALRWTYYGFQWVNTGLTAVNAIVTWGDLKGRCGISLVRWLDVARIARCFHSLGGMVRWSGSRG
jgi:hypothetical protein